ncbi:MAG TPA: selenoprotein O, partial [Allosphingosinicella sp.]
TALLIALETALAGRSVLIDRFFFDWRGGRRRAPSPADAAYEGEGFAAFREAVADYEATVTLDHLYWADEGPCSMHIDEVEAIWSRIDDANDWSAFEAKIAAVRRMGDAMTPPA